ncbi:hypothetical protein SCUP234_07906 [Seiridium cupressi]
MVLNNGLGLPSSAFILASREELLPPADTRGQRASNEPTSPPPTKRKRSQLTQSLPPSISVQQPIACSPSSQDTSTHPTSQGSSAVAPSRDPVGFHPANLPRMFRYVNAPVIYSGYGEWEIPINTGFESDPHLQGPAEREAFIAAVSRRISAELSMKRTSHSAGKLCIFVWGKGPRDAVPQRRFELEFNYSRLRAFGMLRRWNEMVVQGRGVPDLRTFAEVYMAEHLEDAQRRLAGQITGPRRIEPARVRDAPYEGEAKAQGQGTALPQHREPIVIEPMARPTQRRRPRSETKRRSSGYRA